jgi:diguanylate cyclase (GGDEF)-like protein
MEMPAGENHLDFLRQPLSEEDLTSASNQEVLPLLAAALRSVDISLIVFSHHLRVQYATANVQEMLKLPAQCRIVGAELLPLLASGAALDPQVLAALQDLCRKIPQNRETPAASAVLNTQSESYSLSIKVACIDQQYCAVIFEDATARREAENRAMQIALHDALTGLGNRRKFEQDLSAAFTGKSSPSITVVFIDLDRFKAVNDTLGHAVGDEVLRLVGQRLQSIVPDHCSIARLGGDEFAIIAEPAMPDEEAATLATRIIDLVERTYLIGGQVVNIGASLGIAHAPQHAGDQNQLLRNADLALYQSKAAGRGTFHFFTVSMEEQAQERRNMELSLRKALPLRQFEIQYQPQIDVSTQQLTGFEALLHWRHPQKGLLPAEKFMALAEEIGVMGAVGDWMFRSACKEIARWPADIVMTVRVSRNQLESGRLAESVGRALETVSIPGSKLEIEITEDLLLRNESATLETLHQLHALGVRIAMDNFGTGYVSLSQVARFPFDRIRIDRSIVRDRGRDRAIVRAIAALGAALGVSTVAEGVETAEQLAELHWDGCSLVQGCLASDAVSAKDLEKLFGALLAPSLKPVS